MRTIAIVKYLCTALWLLAAASAVHAEWALDGNRVSDPAMLDPWNPLVVPSVDGSVIVVYVAHYTGYHDIWAVRLDQWGNALWDPVPVAMEANEQYAPAAVSDGAGGVIVAWTDFRSGSSEGVYAQRLDMFGAPIWAPNGQALVTAQGTAPRICSDHAGGAIVSWVDGRGVDADIYAQRLDPAGAELWTAGGFGVCTTAGNQGMFSMVSNGAGGAYFAWSIDTGADDDILGQHVVAGGWIDWHLDPAGREICGASGDQLWPVAAADGHGRLLLTWTDFRGGYYDIYAQLVDEHGNGDWTTDGVAVITGPGGRYDPVIISDGAGGAILAWYDGDLWSQRLDAGGAPLWGSAGLVVSDAYGTQDMPQLISNGSNGAIVVWEDSRFGNYDIYAQCIHAAGFVLWAENGVPLCSAMGDQRMARLTEDSAGGGYAVWEDERGEDYWKKIYVQRVDRYGNWGYPSPAIAEVSDIPGDQGWQVNVTWNASRLDPWPNEQIETYSLWRALDPPPETKALPADAILVDLADFVPGQKGRFVRKDAGPDKYLYWEYLGDVLARNLTEYGQALPTLFNLTPASQGFHHFQVIAHGPTPLGAGYWISQPDTGRSIDNLAPAVPAPLAGEQVYGPTRLEITWDPNAEADLSHYQVYRGTAPGFIPTATNLVGSPVEPVLAVTGWDAADWYYKVSARDVHGNESEYALLAPAEVSGAGDVPAATALTGIHPNPFNPKATIAFTVRDPQRITVDIYDVTGRRVTVLTDEVWPAGSHDLTWNGRDTSGREMSSGVYFVNFRSRDTAVTEKVMLVR